MTELVTKECEVTKELSLPPRLVRRKSPSALVFLDGVHFAPHFKLDVRDLGADFVACSPYKFFGPHYGVLYGKYDIMRNKLRPFRVRIFFFQYIFLFRCPGVRV